MWAIVTLRSHALPNFKIKQTYELKIGDIYIYSPPFAINPKPFLTRHNGLT